MLLALSLALLALSGADGCPAACVCGERSDGQDEITCDLPSGEIKVQGLFQDSLEIVCLDEKAKCSEFPEFPFSNNGSLFKLVVTECALDGPLVRCLERFHVRSVDTLAFKEVKSELRAEHLEGLGGVRALRMFYSDVQHSIPSEALAVLPNLTEFRLREARATAPLPMTNLPLTYLELSSDHIEQLADGAFQLDNLEQLLIWDNKIGSITKDNFKGLTSLKNLDISRNRIRVLPAGVFSHTPRLTKLSISVNPIEEVHSDAFQGLKELKRIEAFNNAAAMRLFPRSLSNLPSLEVIEFKNCKITSLPTDLLLNSTQIINITITGNDFKMLPDDLFRDQQLLTHLDLSRNKIRKVARKVFWPLGSMVELNLDYNFIEELNEDFVMGASLQILRINNNRLHHISATAFTHAVGLRDIYLSNNQLTLLDHSRNDNNSTGFDGMYMEPTQSQFRTLFNLERLDLSGNRISTVFDDWRYVLLKNLKYVNLSRNAFKDLIDSDVQFASDKPDAIFDLSHNEITSVLLTNPFGFQPEELYTDQLQSTILLNGNPFICDCTMQIFILKLHSRFPYYSRIPKFDLGSASCVEPSNLKGKLVKDLDPSILTCPVKSEECPEACSCDIQPFTKTFEINCTSLPENLPNPTKYGMNATYLVLTSLPNRLDLPSHVDRLVLSNLHINKLISIPNTVKYVDLSNSGLKDIPVKLLNRNMTMKLGENPLICDCEHEKDVVVLRNNKYKVVDNSTVRCKGGQSPWQIDVLRLCSVRRAALLGGSLAIFSVIIIILAGLYYRYSIQIKIYIYSCEKLRWLITEEEMDSDKRYDAFISFSHKDEKFVAEKLIPVLETGSRPFKLCVHYRDWIVGEWIPAQIVNSVEQSRRTIIVLSKSFVESVWGTMEFRVAHKRAQEEKRMRIVVILLEDAPPSEELDPELRAYLSTNTYVKWGDPWFWEKLRYALAGGRVGSVGKLKEKTPKGGLNAYLNSNGQIVNDSKDTLSTNLSIA